MSQIAVLPKAQKSPKFPLYDVNALMSLPPMEWLIEGIYPASALLCVYGAPGAGKSFLTLDHALSIAAGLDWQGRPVQQGPVVYLAAEGLSGLPNRVRAWQLAHPDADLTDFFIVPQTVNLRSYADKVERSREGTDVDMLHNTVDSLDRPPVLIVVDTLARSLVGGDENSAQDMGWAIGACDNLRETYGCAVLVVHHSTKSGAGERGSGALRGACDTMAELTQDSGVVSLKCSKQKDAAAFPTHTFSFQQQGPSTVLKLESATGKAPSQGGWAASPPWEQGNRGGMF
jgi:RecA-family ATPase